MKRLLLTLTAFVAVLTTFAENKFDEDWAASFTPVSDSIELKGVHTAAAADGSVYVSSTYNQAFTFAGKEIADPEGLTSAVIVKYDGNGKELWAVNMVGNAVVYALDTDADGTLYAAGNFMDKVEYTGTDGAKAEISSETVYSAFVAKISKDGKFEAVKSITPAVNETVASAVGDPWGAGFDSPLYSMWDPIYVTPNKIQVDGDKVYVSAKYMGDVAALGWKGSYIDMFGMMYTDNYSMGVFSVNKADLSGESNVANVQMTGVIAETQYYPEALSFVAENGTVYVGFIGFQQLTLTTAAGAKDFSFAASEDGSMEHAFVLATIGATTTTKAYNAAAHGKLSVPYNLFMNADGENLIIGGTFYGELPLDNQKTTGELASDIFMASVKKADGTVNSTFVSGKESEVASMVAMDNTAVLSSTNDEAYVMDFEVGEATSIAEPTIVCTDLYEEEVWARVYRTATSVQVKGVTYSEESEGNEGVVTSGWTSLFAPVSDAAELKGVHTVTAADGSVYVSSTYNQAFTFAGKEIADPEGLTSAVIVKYDGNGKELWAVNMVGNAVVYALDTDADGTLYAAGNFMDKVEYTGTDGVKAEISSETVYSAFIAKINKDGKFEAVKTITPAVNEKVASAVGDPWGEGVESPLYSMWDPIYVAPNKIQVDGDKVYVSAKYMGDVAALGWKGSYIDMFGMMYTDNYSMGVFSVNKADLSGESNVANVQMTGVIAETQYYPEALSFVAENGTVYVGFIGFQQLTLTTAAGAKDFSFAASEDGSMEHAFVLATIGATTTTKAYNAAAHGKLSVPYNLFMNADGENLIIGGTFYGELPLDNQKTTGELASDIFMASVKKADGIVNSTFVSGKESEATCMTIDNESAILSASIGEVYLMSLQSGEYTTQGSPAYACIDACGAATKASVYCTEGKVCVNGSFNAAHSIEEIIRPVLPQNGLIYNISGQVVNENYKGIVIKNGMKYFQR